MTVLNALATLLGKPPLPANYAARAAAITSSKAEVERSRAANADRAQQTLAAGNAAASTACDELDTALAAREAELDAELASELHTPKLVALAKAWAEEPLRSRTQPLMVALAALDARAHDHLGHGLHWQSVALLFAADILERDPSTAASLAKHGRGYQDIQGIAGAVSTFLAAAKAGDVMRALDALKALEKALVSQSKASPEPATSEHAETLAAIRSTATYPHATARLIALQAKRDRATEARRAADRRRFLIEQARLGNRDARAALPANDLDVLDAERFPGNESLEESEADE
ncbi:MAG: hypothetical protein ABW061_11715 [Polyangiaceae bacterium]